MKKIKPKYILIAILLFAFFTRLYRLNYPNAYVFDEVYHAFTAKEYIKGNPAAWEWWTIPPPGVAYEWTHPPLAKEFMALSMEVLHTTDSWAYRLPGALLGVLSVWLVYLLSKQIFQNNLSPSASETVSLLSSFLFSIDGLNFVQSRTGMNDIYVVTFSLISLLFFLRKKWFVSSIFFGLALASKWSAIYLLGFYFILFVKEFGNLKDIIFKTSKTFILMALFIIVAIILYLLSYIPFFQLHHTFNQFLELQRQMLYYHTHLKAHHDYSSPWWSWPLDLYPVWYYVEYFPNKVANIFTAGNMVVFWLGSLSIILSLLDFVKNKASRILLVPIIGFLIFWLPWALSPRIMFLYHFSPSVPFLCIILAYQVYKLSKGNQWVIISIASISLLGFILLYPWMTGVALPKNLDQSFFLFNLAKNPFR